MDTLLDHPVLVLNRFWQPVQTCSVRRALHLLCVGHARVVQTDGDWVLAYWEFDSPSSAVWILVDGRVRLARA